MATLIKQNGRYYLQFFDLNRSPLRKKVALKTTRKGPALTKQRELEDAFVERKYDPWTDDPFSYFLPEAQVVTVARARDAFLSEKAEDGRTTNTLRTYKEIIDLFLKSVPDDITLETVKEGALRVFVRDPILSPATQHKRYGHLRTFFRWCVSSGFILRSPLAGLDPPSKPAKLPKSISEPELLQLTRPSDETTR